MKKQIIILMFLSLALITANLKNAYGQVTPRPLDCIVTEGPLNPLLGKTYTYAVEIPNDAEFTGTDGITYRWMVTKDKTFITSGSIVANPAAAADFDVITGTHNAQDASDRISISWNALATDSDPYFLIVNVIGDNGECLPQNMKVYKIVPVNMFTLDLVNVDATTLAPLGWETDGTASIFEQCVQDVQSAVWKQDSEDVIYDFGSNTLIWAVTAANWTTSWTPTLQIDGVNALEFIESVSWSRTADGAANGSFTLNGTDWETTTVVTPSDVATNGPNVGAGGEVIFIRMVLDHTTASTFFEGLVDQTITLSIDGVTANGDADVHFEDWTSTDFTGVCGTEDGFENDKATQNLLQRPAINTNTQPEGGTEPLLNVVPN